MTLIDTKEAFLLDSLSTSVLLFDEARRITYINAAGENLLSLSSRATKGQTAENILPESPAFAEAIQRSLDSRYPYVEWGMEINLPSMKQLVADCVFTPICYQDQENLLIVEMVDAHSHHRFKREESILSQHQTAKESAKALAHEVKNPLGGIRGAAQLLRQELDDEQLREYTDIVIQEADRLRNLVDKMLATDREFSFKPVNIHEVLEYVCNLITAEADFEHTIYRDYDPSLPEITADRESMIQVFLNLIRNAVQAISVGGQVSIKTRSERKVTIAHMMHKLCLRVDIIDDGKGIPNDIAESIFYPMITSRADGSGLGLPIAQSLIQQHGGFIEHNRTHEHTVFTVLLPWESHDE